MTTEVLEAQPCLAGTHHVGSHRRCHPGGFALAFWWLDPATVYAMSLVGIAFIYIGFAVADGRRRVIAVEC